MVSTLPSHGSSRGSRPLGDAKYNMKVQKTTSAQMPFKDHFKKEQQKKKEQEKKKAVVKSEKKTDSNFIGWA
jgi:hypothetical protein